VLVSSRGHLQGHIWGVNWCFGPWHLIHLVNRVHDVMQVVLLTQIANLSINNLSVSTWKKIRGCIFYNLGLFLSWHLLHRLNVLSKLLILNRALLKFLSNFPHFFAHSFIHTCSLFSNFSELVRVLCMQITTLPWMNRRWFSNIKWHANLFVFFFWKFNLRRLITSIIHLRKLLY